MEGVTALGDAIHDNGAISSVNLLKNRLPIEQAQELVKIMQSKEKLVTLCGLRKDETELDFSGQRLGAGDAVLIANDISDMGAISSVNLLRNKIPAEQAQELVKVMQAKEKLTTLCGLSRDETELDFSGQNLGAGDAVLIANDISDTRALSVLNLASNNLGELVLPEGWTATGYAYNDTKLFRHTDGREQKGNPSKPEGVIAIANVIPDMEALTKLDISNNNIAQGQALQQITGCCSTKGIELASNAQ
jgi:hypothetical protein